MHRDCMQNDRTFPFRMQASRRSAVADTPCGENFRALRTAPPVPGASIRERVTNAMRAIPPTSD